MNPLGWKREHRTAFFIAVGIGCLAGLLIAAMRLEPRHYFPAEYVLRLIFWTLLGGFLAGSVVYMRQLLRA